MNDYQFSGTHTCDEWEIRNYFDEVADYVNSLNRYIEEAIDFANAAIELHNEVVAYAKCEIREVQSQHQ